MHSGLGKVSRPEFFCGRVFGVGELECFRVYEYGIFYGTTKSSRVAATEALEVTAYKRRKGGFESPQPPLILSVRIEIFRVGRF
jgi:hypothetical protein